MEHSFNKLELAQKNNVENLMKWFTDANIITSTDDEDRVKTYFLETGDNPQNVSWSAFNQVLVKIANDQGKNYHYLIKFLGFDLLKRAIMSAVGHSMKSRSVRQGADHKF
ncbi:uncharacterized protein LOC113238864 isoform X1 [Hyposmocoma kahamanoa]|uniref:uncharacterized protein LOC113238864 isoform X1 n=1 Tax=Hyposmocoma kahamanoa TaxID=1477025 RepID=UPI000E6D7A80|nr:uncharacterized protein LOC113238864 isoform X1 [Hyposmocoma kahamanoa]